MTKRLHDDTYSEAIELREAAAASRRARSALAAGTPDAEAEARSRVTMASARVTMAAARVMMAAARETMAEARVTMALAVADMAAREGMPGAGPVYVHTDREGRGPPDPDDPVYTLTTIRGQSGWNTDSGCPGYGLTLAEALFYRDAANAAIAAGAVFPAEGGDA